MTTGFPGPETTARLPEWLRPLADAAADLEAHAWSRFVPPADRPVREAAVLVLFGDSTDGPTVLLLERAHDLRTHSAQMAFPGGGQDADDDDEIATALREAAEETGLDPAGVDVFGVLPRLWIGPSEFAVTPVLGWWRAPSPVRAVDPAETASVHVVPVATLLEPANRCSVTHPSGYRGEGFVLDDLLVWGFTAGLLSRIFALLGWERPWDADHELPVPEAQIPRALRQGSADRR